VSSSLSQLYPEPVEITLAGRQYKVSQLRIRDIASIQAFLEAYCPHPFASMDDFYAMEGDEREAAILKIGREDYSWPVVFGSEEADKVLASVGGLAFLLLISLGRYQTITHQESLDLARAMNEDEVSRFLCTVYDISWRQRFYTLLNPPRPRVVQEGLKPAIDEWGESIVNLAKDMSWNWSFAKSG
jgi:hypothetical protein